MVCVCVCVCVRCMCVCVCVCVWCVCMMNECGKWDYKYRLASLGNSLENGHLLLSYIHVAFA